MGGWHLCVARRLWQPLLCKMQSHIFSSFFPPLSLPLGLGVEIKLNPTPAARHHFLHQWCWCRWRIPMVRNDEVSISTTFSNSPPPSPPCWLFHIFPSLPQKFKSCLSISSNLIWTACVGRGKHKRRADIWLLFDGGSRDPRGPFWPLILVWHMYCSSKMLFLSNSMSNSKIKLLSKTLSLTFFLTTEFVLLTVCKVAQ